MQAVRTNAEWRRWDEADRWHWDEEKRKRWAEEIMLSSHRRARQRQRFLEQMERQRCAPEPRSASAQQSSSFQVLGHVSDAMSMLGFVPSISLVSYSALCIFRDHFSVDRNFVHSSLVLCSEIAATLGAGIGRQPR